jgi:mercuric ion transport protein
MATTSHKSFWLNTGALLSAAGVSLSWFCCLPLGLFGVGAAAFGVALAPWRPYLLGVAAVFLSLAFYQAYKPEPKEDCESGSECAAPARRRRQRLVVWIVTLLTLALATTSYWASWVLYWLL